VIGRPRSTGSPLDNAKGDLPASVWPPSFSTASAPVVAAVFQLERSQYFAPTEIREGQQRQLSALAEHFVKHSPWFAARMAAARGSEGADRLRRLPILSRRDVQSNFAQQHVTALPEGYGPASQVSTSGSTGEPVSLWRTQVNLLHWLAQTVRWHLWDEPDFSGRLATIRSLMPTSGVADSWGNPVALFADTGPLLRIDNWNDIGKQIDALVEFEPTSLIVYPSNLDAILSEMDVRGYRLPSLKRVRTLGETLSDDLRKRTKRQLGVRVSDCYTSEEFGYIALQCPQSELYHVMAESLIVEVIDDAGRACTDGQIGRIVVTDLHNFATPMIRYETGDHAVAGPKSCTCGRGLPTLRKVLGRTRNIFTRLDGTRHWPMTGYKKYRDIAPIMQYQLVQRAVDAIEMRLVTERPLSAEEEAALQAHLRKTLGPGIHVTFIYYEGRLPLNANGKFEEFLSLIGEM
jgi:phenylacetate-CoA ligase